MAADTPPLPVQPALPGRAGSGGRPIGSAADGSAFEAAVADVAAEEGGSGRAAATDRPAGARPPAEGVPTDPPGSAPARSRAAGALTGASGLLPPRADGDGRVQARTAGGLSLETRRPARSAGDPDSSRLLAEQAAGGERSDDSGATPLLPGIGVAGDPSLPPGASGSTPGEPEDANGVGVAGLPSGAPALSGLAWPASARTAGDLSRAGEGHVADGPGVLPRTGARLPGDGADGRRTTGGSLATTAAFASLDGPALPRGPTPDAAVPDIVAPDLEGLKALLASPSTARERAGETGAAPRPGDGARMMVVPTRSRPGADAGAVLRVLQSVARGRADPTPPGAAGSLAADAEPAGGAADQEVASVRPNPGAPLPGAAIDGRLRSDGGAGLTRVASRIGPAVAATLAASAGPDAVERFQARILRQETHLPILVELSVAGQQVADALKGLPPPTGPTATAGADPVRVDLTAPPLHVLEIQLQPVELGSVRVELRAAGDRLAVRIIADEPETARLLTEDASALGRRLEAAGYTADGLVIQVVSDAGLPRLPVSSTGANGNPAANGGQEQAGNGQPGGGQPSGGPGGDGSGRNDHARRDDTADFGGTPGAGGVWL